MQPTVAQPVQSVASLRFVREHIVQWETPSVLSILPSSLHVRICMISRMGLYGYSAFFGWPIFFVGRPCSSHHISGGGYSGTYGRFHGAFLTFALFVRPALLKNGFGGFPE